MANFTVTTIADENDAEVFGAMTYLGSGLSLREAIALANSTVGSDKITFDPSLAAGTIVLTNGQLTVTESVAIQGDADNDTATMITVDADGQSRVFEFTAGSTSSIIQNLAIVGGAVVGDGGGVGSPEGDDALGGGIYNAGGLTIANSAIQFNLAAGGGAGTNHTGGGGGFVGAVGFNAANTGGDGGDGATSTGNPGTSTEGGTGGSGAYGPETTFPEPGAGGPASTGGAGSYAGGRDGRSGYFGGAGGAGGSDAGSGGGGGAGGALFGPGGSSSTEFDGFAGGSAAGGIFNAAGATLRITSTLFLGNAAFGGGGSGGTGFAQGTGGDGGSAAAQIDNLSGGSVYIDQQTYDSFSVSLAYGGSGGLGGYNNGTGVLGLSGAAGAQGQILGAYTVIETPSLIVTTLNDVVDQTDGLISLREAIAYANDVTANGGSGDADNDGNSNDTITFDPSLSGGTITLTGGQLALTSDVTIDGDINGDDKADIAVSGGNTTRILDITSGTTSAESITLTNGRAEYGAAIKVSGAGSLTLFSSTVSDNNATINGGAITAEYGGSVYIANSTIANNVSADRGGAIELFSFASATIVNSTISGNTAVSYGGGAIVQDSTSSLTLLNSTVTGNMAGYAGGGLSNGPVISAGTLTINNSIVLGNGSGAGPEIDGPYTGSNNIIGGYDPSEVFAATDPATGGGLLADNGGPVQTVALLRNLDNPALDASGAGATPVDARGLAAFDQPFVPNDPGIRDLGAFELRLNANNPPIAVDDVAMAGVDLPVIISETALLLNDSDPEGDPLSITGVSNAVNGSVMLNGDGTITFTPAPGFTGEARFDYTITDGFLNNDTGTVFVTVFTPDPLSPSAPAMQQVFITEDMASPSVDIAASDPSGAPIAFAIAGGNAPMLGTVVLGNNTFVYTPFADANGMDDFTILITFGDGSTDEQLIKVTIAPVPDAPVAGDDLFETVENTAIAIGEAALLANDTDVDGDTLMVGSVADAVGGTVIFDGDTVLFTPGEGFVGTASFTYTVFDGNAGSDTGLVEIEVLPGEEAPNQDPQVDAVQDACVLAGRDVLVTVLASDADGDQLTYGAGSAANGTVVAGADGAFTYTPDAGFAGTDSFIVTVEDGEGGSASQEVTVSVVDPAFTAQWNLVTDSDYTGSIGGFGQVFGTAGNEDVTVLDVPGAVAFDPSFNSGDIVRLAGDATDWKITLSGSNAILTDGDTLVIVPARPDVIPLVFADGVRGLVIGFGALNIGGQVVTEDFETIAAEPDGTALPGGSDPIASADLLFNPGGEAVVAGIAEIYGTEAAETVLVLSGGATFDPSFNGAAGVADTIAFGSDAAAFTAQLSGSNAVLSSADTTATIPVGPVPGAMLEFTDGSATLSFNPVTNTASIGDLVLNDTATPLSFA